MGPGKRIHSQVDFLSYGWNCSWDNKEEAHHDATHVIDRGETIYLEEDI